MIIPNKFLSFDETILSKLEYVLVHIDDGMPILDLFRKVNKKLKDINQFILALDTLYFLELIKVDFEKRIIQKC